MLAKGLKMWREAEIIILLVVRRILPRQNRRREVSIKIERN